MSIAVGFGARQRLSRGIEPGDFDASNSPAIDERTHEYIRAFVEEAQMHAEITDVKISCLGIVTKAARLRHDCDIHAGLSQFSDILDRNICDAPPIGLPFGRETPDVDAFGQTSEIIQLIEPYRAMQ